MSNKSLNLGALNDLMSQLKTAGLGGVSSGTKMPETPLWWFNLAYAEAKPLNTDDLIHIAKGSLFSYALSHNGQVLSQSYEYKNNNKDKMITDLTASGARLVYHKLITYQQDSEKMFFIADDGAVFLTHFESRDISSWANVVALKSSFIDKIKPILISKTI